MTTCSPRDRSPPAVQKQPLRPRSTPAGSGRTPRFSRPPPRPNGGSPIIDRLIWRRGSFPAASSTCARPGSGRSDAHRPPDAHRFSTSHVQAPELVAERPLKLRCLGRVLFLRAVLRGTFKTRPIFPASNTPLSPQLDLMLTAQPVLDFLGRFQHPPSSQPGTPPAPCP